MFQKVQDFGEAFARRAASASELLSDKELRKKASNLVARRAGKRIKNIQHGVQTGADQLGRMGRGLAEGPRQIQAILARLQARVEEQRLQASLQAERDSPVDVQVGHLLCEDAPQELRSRMWMALLDDPGLCGNLLEEKGAEEERAMTGSQRSTRSTSFTSAGGEMSPRAGTSVGSVARQSSAALSRRTSRSGEDDASAAPDTASTASCPAATRPSAADDAPLKRSSRSAGAASDAGSVDAEDRQPRRGGRSAAAASEAGSVGAASLATERGSEAVLGDVEDGPAAARLGATPEVAAEPDTGTQTSTGTDCADAAGKHDLPGDEPGAGWESSNIAPQQGHESTAHLVQPGQGAQSQGASLSGAGRHADPVKDPLRFSDSEHATDSSAAGPSTAAGTSREPLILAGAAECVDADGREPEAEPCTPTYGDVGHLPVARNTPEPRASLQSDLGHMTATSSQDGDAEARLEQWEMVVGASRLYDWHESRLRSPTQAALAHTLSSDSQPPDSLRSRLMAAVWNVEWPISTEYAEEGRYNTLLQISIGQEEVDEVITRDIHRTFPEHPQFGFAQGQQALFRVLKAYSLHDLEVSYCQGMAFVAGVVLMYLPEEPAFRVLVRLMGPGRCDLRSLFLPGLEGLKQLLRCFEWLMHRLMPRLKAHLEEYCALPVLYASQWFLTCFSCPFPAKFACRVIDVMLQEQRPHVLLRVALAVVAECEPDILQLDDFEDIITFLKVEPVKWPDQRMRKVLNNAILSGLVADEMITAAEQALTDGFEGSLSRRTSVAPDPAAAAEAVVAARQRMSEAVARSAGMPSMPEERPSDTGAEDVEETVQLLERRSGDVGGNAADRAAMLDPDYMAMVLAMDTLWAADDSGATDLPQADDSPVPQSPV